MSHQFTLNSLLERGQKDKYYRLDIVRGVSFEDAYDPAMPFKTLIVNFSRYSDEFQTLKEIKTIPAKDIFKSQQIDTTTNLAISVDITNLIFLKPGTVWKNGSPVWESSELTSVVINQAEASIVSSYKESQSGTKMPFIYNDKGVQFLKFPNSKVNGKVVTVLIPTTEVIRYYFSGSTYFTTELFNGALKGYEKSNEASRLFYRYHFDESAKEVYIWLKRHCYDSDSIMIARGLADKAAMNAMSYIYASLFHAKSNFKNKDGTPVSESSPRTSLPFSGSTNLDVIGQWLPPRNGETEFTTFMVRTIEGCDHPLPFEKIKIESIDSYKSCGKVDEDLKPKPSKPKNNNSNDDGELSSPNLTDGEKPSNNIAVEELRFMIRRFSHLTDIEITKVERVSDSEKKRYYQQEVESESNNGSTLAGDYRKDNHLQAWNNKIIDSETMPVTGRLLVVSNAVASINAKEKGWSVQPIPIGYLDTNKPFGLYSFERPGGKAGNYKWSEIEDRSRRALFLAITNESAQTVYLLEIEGKGDVGYSLFLFRAITVDLDRSNGARALMFDIADASGSKIKDETLKSFVVTSMKHTESQNDSFQDRLHRAIRGVFGEMSGIRQA